MIYSLRDTENHICVTCTLGMSEESQFTSSDTPSKRGQHYEQSDVKLPYRFSVLCPFCSTPLQRNPRYFPMFHINNVENVGNVGRRIPPPLGFGLEVHDMTLRRIKAMFLASAVPVQYENSAAAADLIEESIQQNPTQFVPLISELLLQKAFDAARSENEKHELKDLINGVVKLRELELKVQRLQLQREQAQSRPTSKTCTTRRHHVDLNIIPPQRSVPPKIAISERNETPKSAAEK